MIKQLTLSFIVSAFAVSAHAETAASIARETPLMSEPSSRSEVLLRVKPGEKVQVLERLRGWSKVQYRTRDGFEFSAWVPSASLVLSALSQERPATGRKEGEVIYATLGEVFINLGAVDGLRETSTVRVQRRGRTASPCTLSSISDHSSVCIIQGASVGDTVLVTGTVVEEVPQPTKRRQAPVNSGEQARRHAALLQAPVPRVVFRGGYEETGSISPVPVTLSGEHSFWKSYSRERIDVSVHDVEIGSTGLTATADLSAWFWTQESDRALFRPDTPLQFYLAEAGIAYRRASRPYSFSAGRIRLSRVPGLVTLDGVQGGWRIGTAEVGVYGGLVPNLVTLKPETDEWLAGAYAAQALWTTPDLLVRYEWRAGLRHLDSSSSRFETEALLSAALFRFLDLSTEVLLGLAGGGSGPSFDALRADLGLRPSEKLRFQLGARLLENPFPDPVASLGTGSRHLDLQAVYDWGTNLSLALLGGYSKDLGMSEHRAYAGPEVRVRKLFGGRSALVAGGQEEIGWIKGRMFYLQPSFNFSERTGLQARLSYSMSTESDQTTNEWGAYGGFHTRLTSWLSTRAGVQVQGGDSPFGVTGSLSLTGQI